MFGPICVLFMAFIIQGLASEARALHSDGLAWLAKGRQGALAALSGSALQYGAFDEP